MFFRTLRFSPLSALTCSVNSNLDLVVSATGLLRALGVAPGQPADHTSLSSREQLQQQVAHSMLHCAGTERVFTSEEFQLIVKAAYGLPHTVGIAFFLSISSTELGSLSLSHSKMHVHSHVHTHTHTHTQSCIGGNAALMAEKIKQSQKDIEVGPDISLCLATPNGVQACQAAVNICCSAQTGQHSRLQRSCCPVWVLQ